MSIIHRSYVLSSNGYITDDFGPVYRAVSNFRRGWDIYNEHFNYVDPHYLYPPGGTLLMAPFGYMPVFASHNWFVAVNTVAMIIAACLMVRLFGFSLTSVALPALLLAMFFTEVGHQHDRIHQHQRLRPAGRSAVLPLAAVGQGRRPVVGGRRRSGCRWW